MKTKSDARAEAILELVFNDEVEALCTEDFALNHQGEMLVGEATRVSGEARKGVASAYGGRGMFARCEYQMSTPYLGAGTCSFSNGAEYQVHIGS